MHLLIVEDESSIAEGLKFNFEQEGFDVSVAAHGQDALSIVRQGSTPVDLVILDLMLPGMSGYEICNELRLLDSRIPILVLTARSLSQDKIQAFDCGADQYVTKPFDLSEIICRVRNLIKRRDARPQADQELGLDEPFRFGDVEIDWQSFEVRAGENSCGLTTLEMQLLKYFVKHQGRVLSRSQILTDVWEQSPEINSRSIDNFVLRLRKMIEKDPTSPRHILSVRGTGYRFIVDPEPR